MKELLIAYLGVVTTLLVLSTGINSEEGVTFKHIVIAAFGWPLLAPLLAYRAWAAR